MLNDVTLEEQDKLTAMAPAELADLARMTPTIGINLKSVTNDLNQEQTKEQATPKGRGRSSSRNKGG